MSWQDIFAAILLLFAPTAAYLHTLGAARIKPDPKGLLKDPKFKWIIGRRWHISGLNGILFAASFALFKVSSGYFFIVPMIIAIPTLIAQAILVMESRAQFIND